MRRTLTTFALLAGCALAQAAPGPELPAPRQLEDGVWLREVTLPREGGPTTVWIYTPQESAAPQGGRRLPCVLIAPAGTRLCHGIGLADGDRPEHLPYVRAGLAVVAYSLSGPVGDDEDDEVFLAAVGRFLAADGGLQDARAALDYALERVPALDPARIYAVGHSSAATIALQLAWQEARIKACVAFAPATDLVAAFPAEFVEAVGQRHPTMKTFPRQASPLVNAARLRVPLLLFHADDDSVVAPADTRKFLAAVQAGGNTSARLETVPTGDHYDAMLDEGIPRAIKWLQALPR